MAVRVMVCALFFVTALAAPASALPPDAPGQPTVVAGDAQITVSFVAPPDNGDPITSYTASCSSSDGGMAGNQGGTESPLVVLGLTNGKTYTCTVVATNSEDSAPSPPSLPVVPSTVPDTPIQPTVFAENAQITVGFVTPDDNGSPITGYTAACSSSDGGAPGAQAGAASPLVVVGLTNGKTYTCTLIATNALGDSAPSPASVAVMPNSVPDAPLQPLLFPGDAEITVAFAPPASNGSPITGYTASCSSSDGGAPGMQGGTLSPIVVSGLTNAKTYVCTVIATNANGDSPPSPPSTPTSLQGPPDAPVTPSVVPGDARITVSFLAPSDNGSPITGYAATCSSTDGGVGGSATGTASALVVVGLTNAKTYTCSVVATNGRGDSPPSPDSLSTTPRGVPSPPAKPTVVKGNARITVSFGAPADNGSPITGYVATCTSSNGGVARSTSGIASPLVVTSLSNDKSYTCRVVAKNAVGSSAPSPASVAVVPTAPVTVIPTPRGFRLFAGDGGVFVFGNSRYFGSPAGVSRLPLVGMATTRDNGGYWLVATDGGIFSYGNARFYGSTGGMRLNRPIVGMAPTPTGKGYWLVATDGGIFSYGDARFYGSTGSIRLVQPIVGMAATPTGKGYWLVAADGGIFAFGDARFFGSAAGRTGSAVVGIATSATGRGYWIADSRGIVFAFGDAPNLGSVPPNVPLRLPIAGLAATPTGKGYWVVAGDGGVFTFGDAPFYGWPGPLILKKAIRGVTP
jgi:hypothetical protein